jgi:hypothetical protein
VKKVMHNEKGFALITSLLITMLSLVIVMGLLYSIIQNIKLGASQKIYRNAVEASYGGTDVMVNEILPRFFKGDSPATILGSFPSEMNLKFYSKEDGSCLDVKLKTPPSNWASICTGAGATDVNPRIAPDVKFELRGVSSQKFVVYSKIVDTKPGVPYITQPMGGPLEGGGVAALGENGTSKVNHYVYRIEVAGEREINPAEKGVLSVLYEY